MLVTVHIKLTKNKAEVEKISEYEYVVHTAKPAIENKANEDVIRQLADYFHVPKSRVTLVRGATSKQKVFSIET